MPLICNHDIAAEQQARFNIWAANIGVFAEVRSSLEYCLKENSEVRAMILQLLDLIHQNLLRGMFGFFKSLQASLGNAHTCIKEP